MSKLTVWLRSAFALSQADEDRVVAETNAAVNRIFARVRENVEFEMQQLSDLMSSAVHVEVGDIGERTKKDRRQNLINQGHRWLLETAKGRRLAIPQHATKEDLADLILADQ